jgi:LuxR family maltose regulon positive regulatory protein
MTKMTEKGHFMPENEKYIRPFLAWNLLKQAEKMRQTVYIYGASGYGKTSLAAACLRNKENCFWYDMEDSIPQTLTALERTLADRDMEHCSRTIVIDSLQNIYEPEQRDRMYTLLKRITGLRGSWLILISRSQVPLWLKTLYVQNSFLLIGEEELRFSRDEQKHFLGQWNIRLSDRTWELLENMNCNQPVPLKIAAMQFSKCFRQKAENRTQREKQENKAIEQARNDLWDYLETHVYEQWDRDLQEFLMDISIVDEFTPQLARQITRKQNVERLILQAEETGNFLSERKNDDTILYEERETLKRSMRRRLVRMCSEEHIEKLYYHAGSAYELQGKLTEALRMYQKCGNEEGISRVLIENARKYVGIGHYWEFREYYLTLSESVIEKSPELMAGLSLLQSILLNDEESERWYEKLAGYEKKQTGQAKREALEKLLYLDISLPQRDVKKTPELIRKIGILVMSGKAVLPQISLTNNQPSIMNGGKDFCEWSKNDIQLAEGIGRIVELILCDFGKGLVNTALAESQFEKGGDIDRIGSMATRGWIQAEGGGKLENAFSDVAILAEIAVCRNQLDDSLDMMDSFIRKAAREAPQLLPNAETFRLRLLLYRGMTPDAERWLETAPDEYAGFCTLERYRYLMKARVYILLGKYDKAGIILNRMILYGQKRKRVFLTLESLLLLSIVQYRTGSRQWKTTLRTAAAGAEEYHFVRIFSREGSALWELLRDQKDVFKDAAYRDQIMMECAQMAEMYPAYLKEQQEVIIQLSEKAVEILRMQAEGMTVKQIADSLFLSEAGVKYYNQETYRKLGVNGKTAAINTARTRKII